MTRKCNRRAGLSALAISACALLLASCGDVFQQRAGRRPGETSPGDSVTQEHELDELALERLRGLGYLEGDGGAIRGSKPDVSRSPAASLMARDDDALSELREKTRQSLGQRANEALHYLGRRSGKYADSPQKTALANAAPRNRRKPGVAGSEAEKLEELRRYRDAASAQALKDKKRALHLAAGLAASATTPVAEAEEPPISAAQRFEQQRLSLEDLRYLPTSGTWRNTYVPGDPVMRWLESRLETRDRSTLEAFATRPLLLDSAARQVPQPFDAPGTAALSVFVQADRRGLEGENRMLVQVGLKGAERHGGLRPAMQVAIVLDLRTDPGSANAAAMRALVQGFLAAKDLGDRFSLIVAGAPGGELVAADAFRHGPLSVALERLLEPTRTATTREPVLQLEEALRTTSAKLQGGGDPSAPLGSSMILLVTPQPLGPLTDGLSQAAHASAVSGVPLSVVGVGEAVELAEIERIALAGQGNLRLLASAPEAELVVHSELSALSRVIARALRLRIRLAPGVKLVEIVGSELLDTNAAQQVRLAERSIDRRLARNLGIEADRGEDDEGIQIVMPAFYSGDTHAVLLDVVAPGPGPIADVSVRYKDLVYLRNGVARANLHLGRSSDPPGPLEQNVVKNLLAVRLAETLKDAGRSLLAGADAEAVASVRDFQALLAELRDEVPGFQNDADLAGDADMLGEYLAVLDTGALAHAEPRQHLADSLQLSGYFKTIPRSASALRISRR